MTRSSSAGGGSAGLGGAASDGDAGAAGCAADASARAALFASRRCFRDCPSESSLVRKGRESPENGGGVSRHSPAVIEPAGARSAGRRMASLSSGGDKSSGICTGGAERAAEYRASGWQGNVSLREQAATAVSPTITHQVRGERMLRCRNAHACSRHRLEHSRVKLGRKRSQREPNAGADEPHALHGPLDGNRIALAEQFIVQGLEAT